MTKIFTYDSLKRPAIFAHRGSSAFAPENTLAAFTLAKQQGADAIELDAKLSTDGQVVVMHDDSVDRTTNGHGKVAALTLSDLKGLDAGGKFNQAFKGEKIPTLDEVFETVGRQIFINVELTNYSSPTDDLPDRVVSLVKEYSLENSVLLSSFNFIALIRARFLAPSLPLGLLTLPRSAGIILHSKLVRFGPQLALHPAYEDVGVKLVQSAHRSQCRVHTYTVNQPDAIRQAFSDGVDGIFTDDPPLAQKVLAEIQQ